MTLIVGQGIDFHRIQSSDHYCPIMLGGVPVPDKFNVNAVTDGDVILHALCDALLSAVGLPDIGFYFPPSDDKWRGVSSSLLLERVIEIVKQKCNIKLRQVLISFIGERPRLGALRQEIVSNLTRLLSEVADRQHPMIVSLNATTPEQLFMTNPMGIGAFVTILAEVDS